MSAITLAWVATIKVGNQTAKQLLQFYASHNFKKSGYEFKIETLANQLEVSERSIQNAHKLLVSKGFLIKTERFSKDGSQLPSNYDFNIPDEFVDNFFREGETNAPSPRTTCTPRGAPRAPLSINNNINNKEREPARKKRVPLPDDLVLDDQTTQLLEETSKRVNLSKSHLLLKFKNIHGKERHDNWNAKIQNFLINERGIGKSINKPTASTNSYSNMRDFTQERLDRERLAREEMTINYS